MPSNHHSPAILRHAAIALATLGMLLAAVLLVPPAALTAALLLSGSTLLVIVTKQRTVQPSTRTTQGIDTLSS